MTQDHPPKDEYDAHELMKLLGKVAEKATVPEEVETVVIPEESFAELLVPLFEGRVTVLSPTAPGKLKLHAGPHSTTIPEGAYDEETTLDLRLAKMSPRGDSGE